MKMTAFAALGFALIAQGSLAATVERFTQAEDFLPNTFNPLAEVVGTAPRGFENIQGFEYGPFGPVNPTPQVSGSLIAGFSISYVEATDTLTLRVQDAMTSVMDWGLQDADSILISAFGDSVILSNLFLNVPSPGTNLTETDDLASDPSSANDANFILVSGLGAETDWILTGQANFQRGQGVEPEFRVRVGATVPVPASGLLLLGGLGALAIARRRRAS